MGKRRIKTPLPDGAPAPSRSVLVPGIEDPNRRPALGASKYLPRSFKVVIEIPCNATATALEVKVASPDDQQGAPGQGADAAALYDLAAEHGKTLAAAVASYMSGKPADQLIQVDGPELAEGGLDGALEAALAKAASREAEQGRCIVHGDAPCAPTQVSPPSTLGEGLAPEPAPARRGDGRVDLPIVKYDPRGGRA